MRTPFCFIISCIIVASLFSACGQYGKLYLPDQSKIPLTHPIYMKKQTVRHDL